MQPLILIESILEEGHLVLQIALLQDPVVVLVHELALPVVLGDQSVDLLLVHLFQLEVLLLALLGLFQGGLQGLALLLRLVEGRA